MPSGSQSHKMPLSMPKEEDFFEKKLIFTQFHSQSIMECVRIGSVDGPQGPE